MDEARRVTGDVGITYCESLSAALLDIDAVIVVTPWPEFRQVSVLLRGRRPAPVFVDVRRAFDRGSVERYEGIGL
jgi:UDP-glucose 6-dehydrogenase